ncbi:hypothetical protein VP01_1844g1 [Puccinia sorghi]|uniref:Uncharacterized protein n=1 Tax=Puccinia sorghi TaxID=27349 RepID=A0A0L6VDN0_9BASI|nr:hypothetical protein VP01_1844g1 [Puccinia sorghi]
MSAGLSGQTWSFLCSDPSLDVTILRRAPDPLPAKNASPTTTKHDTSSESGSDEGTHEVETPTSTTRSASSTGLVTMTITKDVLPTAVTLVFQVGASPTGTTIVLGSVSTASQPVATATSVPISFPATQPSPSPSGNPAQLPNLENHPTDSHLSNSAPLIAGIVAGVVGLGLVAFAIFITMALRRRRKERELLNMMAPSQLQNPFFHIMQSDPRQSFTWVGPIDKPSSRRGSRMAL